MNYDDIHLESVICITIRLCKHKNVYIYICMYVCVYVCMYMLMACIIHNMHMVPCSVFAPLQGI